VVSAAPRKKSKPVSRRTKRPAKRVKQTPSLHPAEVIPESSLTEVTKEVRALADRMLGSAASAAAKRLRAVTGIDLEEAASPVIQTLAKARAISAAANTLLALSPAATTSAAWGKAGSMIRQLREQAGLTLQEVGQAVNLRDPELMAAVESGRVALPFEMVLRLAAVLGRKDPLTAAMALTRASYPQVWEALESLGIGRLVLQSGREREFVNVLRADDRARRLNDAEFAELLAFVKAALGLALAFKGRAVAKTKR
jgi:transcriptional regulator with XRE-family HTH domain